MKSFDMDTYAHFLPKTHACFGPVLNIEEKLQQFSN
jgi:hypothetical protein